MPADTSTLRPLLAAQPGLLFAVLVGSRATGTAQPGSDWDIALQWDFTQPWLEVLGRTETLRCQLANALQVPEQAVDLIELHRSNLAMRDAVAEEGEILSGDNTLDWERFLRRTWRELEEVYWDQAHA